MLNIDHPDHSCRDCRHKDSDIHLDPCKTCMATKPSCSKWQHQISFKIEPRIEDNTKLIIDITDAHGQVMRKILDTQDKIIRNALISMGWTPPEMQCKCGMSSTEPYEGCPQHNGSPFPPEGESK